MARRCDDHVVASFMGGTWTCHWCEGSWAYGEEPAHKPGCEVRYCVGCGEAVAGEGLCEVCRAAESSPPSWDDAELASNLRAAHAPDHRASKQRAVLGLWERGEPEWLPWGIPHRFVVWMPDVQEYAILARVPWSGDPVGAGMRHRYQFQADVSAGEWNPSWLWIYLPQLPEDDR